MIVVLEMTRTLSENKVSEKVSDQLAEAGLVENLRESILGTGLVEINIWPAKPNDLKSRRDCPGMLPGSQANWV